MPLLREALGPMAGPASSRQPAALPQPKRARLPWRPPPSSASSWTWWPSVGSCGGGAADVDAAEASTKAKAPPCLPPDVRDPRSAAWRAVAVASTSCWRLCTRQKLHSNSSFWMSLSSRRAKVCLRPPELWAISWNVANQRLISQ